MERKYAMTVVENGRSGGCPNCGRENVRFARITVIDKASGEIVRGMDEAEINCCVPCVKAWRYGPSTFVSQHGINPFSVEFTP